MGIRAVALGALVTLAGLYSAAPPAGAATPGGAGPAGAATSAAGHRGFTTERLWGPHNDWEPNIAADPSSPWLYQMTTQYGGHRVCQSRMDHCVLVRASPDDGRTWGRATVMPRALCPPGKFCRLAAWQNGPVIAVSSSGVIYAAWMNQWDVTFGRSGDHGRTRTALHDFRRALAVSFTDKPWIAISASGKDVYVAFNSSDSYVSASHDYGRTWATPVQTNANGRYWFAEAGAVAPDGGVYFAESAEHQDTKGDILLAVLSSADGGATWRTSYVARSQQQPRCPVKACPNDFYGAQIALAIDPAGTIMASYVASTTAQAPMRLEEITSADGGRSWTAPRALGSHATLAGAKSRAGFQFPYGDYFGITVDSHGTSYLTWSEGTSYLGPGGTLAGARRLDASEWWTAPHGPGRLGHDHGEGGRHMLNYALVRPAVQRSSLGALPPYLLMLMLRNVASDGFAFTDPADPARFSAPGCIIASPSFAGDQAAVTQNYVYNWTRDAAVTAMELAAAGLPAGDAGGTGPLDDYVSFASTCQQNAPGLDTASYTIEGQPRQGWTLQNDGPALQALAIFQAFAQLGPAAQGTAVTVAERDLQFIVDRYQTPNTNLWEEVAGQSFFTRAVQLQCLLRAQGNLLGITVPPGAGDAIAWLRAALASHWNGQYYVSVLDAQNPRWGYDPNIDIVMASVYGAVDCADPQLLATAALLREQWADPGSPIHYPINPADAAQGLGPLLGRYPGDSYDGNQNAPAQGHPWALTTANFAELYYRLAARIQQTGQVPASPLAADYLGQAGVGAGTTAAAAAQMLLAAGDQMLQAIVYHSDHLELSEQFDAVTGYEKSVRNLTWSYAAFLSAMRARAAVAA